MDKRPITPQGKQRLEDELQERVKVDREEIKTALVEARALGDLKENAEYHAAREKQSHNEGRIQELQSILGFVEVIDNSQSESEQALFGCFVTVHDPEKEQTQTYQLVGPDEADIRENRISITSPLGRAILGKEEGGFLENAFLF